MEGENSVTRSMTDDLRSSDNQCDQIAGESGVTRTIIDEIHSSAIQADQMKGESGVTRSIMITFILRTCKDIKWKVKVL